MVCSDWVPPITAARPSYAVLTMLFSGCWAVSEQPAVWVWKRSSSESSFFTSKRSFITLDQMRRAARYLATSSKKSMWELKKKESLGAKSSTSIPASIPACT